VVEEATVRPHPATARSWTVNEEEGLIMSLMAGLGGHCLSTDLMTRWWGIGLVGVLLAWGALWTVAEAASATPRPVSHILWVGFHNGLLSLEAKDAPAQRVLDEVCAKAGVVLQASISLQGPVTASFKDLPVERAFRRLFGSDANFIFLYHGPKPASGAMAVPSEVWVLAKGTGKAPQTATAPDDQAKEALSVEDTQNPVQEIEREFARNPLAVQNAAMGSRHPEVRLKAIAYLGQQPTRESVDILMKVATLDPHAEPPIQQGALDALVGLVHSSPQVQELVAQHIETLGEPEPKMRQLAADLLGIQLEPTGNEAASE
jgi:hypothetical protein